MHRTFERQTHLSARETDDGLVVTARCAESEIGCGNTEPISIHLCFSGNDLILRDVKVTRGNATPHLPGWARTLVGRSMPIDVLSALRHDEGQDEAEREARRLALDAVDVAHRWRPGRTPRTDGGTESGAWRALGVKW